MAKQKNRKTIPGDRVTVVGESAKDLKKRRHFTQGIVEDAVRETVWVRLDSGKLIGVPDSDVRVIKTERASNPKKLKTALLR